MKNLVLGVVLMGVFSFIGTSLSAQDVNNYPKDGKIKNLKGRVQEDIVVAKDGTGDFLFISDAIEAIRVFLPQPITVFIKEGVYREKLEIPATITNVIFKGEGPDKTKIVYDDFSGKGKIGTFESYTLKVSGNTLTFKDLTIENSAGPVGQAVALHTDGDRLVFENCHFIGNQDTMFASGENQRQYYKNCYIEGTTDFIFGSGTALFENCEIHSKRNSYITAASTPQWVEYGYVFKDCKLTAAKDVDKVYLGRPWRAYAKTVFINCKMGEHIAEERWHNWGNPENEKTVFYAEGGSSGPGGNTSNSVNWAVQLDSLEINHYSDEKIFEGKTGQLNKTGEIWYKISTE